MYLSEQIFSTDFDACDVFDDSRWWYRFADTAVRAFADVRRALGHQAIPQLPPTSVSALEYTLAERAAYNSTDDDDSPSPRRIVPRWIDDAGAWKIALETQFFRLEAEAGPRAEISPRLYLRDGDGYVSVGSLSGDDQPHDLADELIAALTGREFRQDWGEHHGYRFQAYYRALCALADHVEPAESLRLAALSFLRAANAEDGRVAAARAARDAAGRGARAVDPTPSQPIGSSGWAGQEAEHAQPVR